MSAFVAPFDAQILAEAAYPDESQTRAYLALAASLRRERRGWARVWRKTTDPFADNFGFPRYRIRHDGLIQILISGTA